MIDKLNHQPPPYFFKRGPSPLARLIAFASFSFLLLVLDARFHGVDLLRESLGTVMLSIQQVAHSSTRWVSSIEEEIADRARLSTELEKLRAEQYENRTVYTQIEFLTEENNKLRQLLALQQRMTGTVVAAEVIYELNDPFLQKVALDKGSRHGIRAGQAVVSPNGLFGQITKTYPLMSEVTLITDPTSATPVQVLRNGLRAVAMGGPDGEMLELRYQEIATDIEVGDQMVTSGIDGLYLPGIPVSTVTSVDRRPVSAFATILSKPETEFRQQKHVLVLVQAERELPNPFLPANKLTPDPLPPIPEVAPPRLMEALPVSESNDLSLPSSAD